MHLAQEYDPTEIPRHFRDLAFAYLDASHRLCRDMESGAWPGDYLKGQVTMLLAFHASELLLKGCIRAASKSTKNLHSLGELLIEFESFYPAVKFEPPFGPEPVRADYELMEWALESDRTLHQQFRYPTDTSGKQWSGIRSFDPGTFRLQLDVLRLDFERISRTIIEK